MKSVKSKRSAMRTFTVLSDLSADASFTTFKTESNELGFRVVSQRQRGAAQVTACRGGARVARARTCRSSPDGSDHQGSANRTFWAGNGL